MWNDDSQAYSNEPCPACGGIGLQFGGQVYYPPEPKVAGVAIELPAGGCFLKQCSACGFQFKFPPIAPAALLECYAKSDAANWGTDPRQRRFDAIKAAVLRHASGRHILDVGCFTGGLLDYFGPEWNRYGLEPSRAAAKVAGERGIQILGATLDDIEPHPRFDVILAIDVIEHVSDPAAFFSRVSQLLNPGGIFVVFTGDSNAWTWRLQQSRYWYVSFLPEHISFYCRKTVSILAERHAMRRLEYSRVSHDRLPLNIVLFELAKGITFGALYRTNWLGLAPLRRKLQYRAGTAWTSAADHMIYVMKRGD